MCGPIKILIVKKDITSIVNDLEISFNGRNKAPMVDGVDKSSKSPLFDYSEKIEEHDE